MVDTSKEIEFEGSGNGKNCSNPSHSTQTFEAALGVGGVADSPEKYQADTRQRITKNAAEVTTPVYVQARRQIDLLRRESTRIFGSVDLLVTPTLPSPPVLITQAASPSAVSIHNTSPFDVLGLPTISIPCGFTTLGLPIGLQIVGAPFAELKVLALAHDYERETEWHKRHPTLNPA